MNPWALGSGPLMGWGVLPIDLTMQAADIFRKHLGFDESPDSTETDSGLKANGDRGGRVPTKSRHANASCYDMFEEIADKKK